MIKVYIRFGEFSKNATISVFEAIIEDKIVRIILPTTSYHACQNMAKYVELPAFIVDGAINGKDKNGETLMNNVKIKIPLTFNKDIENYVSDISIPKPREKQKNMKIPKWRQNKFG